MLIVKNTVQLNGMYGKTVPNTANLKDIFYEQADELKIRTKVSINAEQKAKPLILEKADIDAKKPGTPPVGLVNKKFDW